MRARQRISVGQESGNQLATSPGGSRVSVGIAKLFLKYTSTCKHTENLYGKKQHLSLYSTEISTPLTVRVSQFLLPYQLP